MFLRITHVLRKKLSGIEYPLKTRSSHLPVGEAARTEAGTLNQHSKVVGASAFYAAIGFVFGCQPRQYIRSEPVELALAWGAQRVKSGQS